MFGALLKSRMTALLNSFGRGMKNGKQKKRSPIIKILLALLFVYVIGVFLMMFGMLFYQLAAPFNEAGLGWFYFALAGLLSTALMFIGSVFMTMTQLYEARDNELLLSMPIPPSMILASRMTVLLAVNVGFELLIMIPAGVIWCLCATVTPVGVISFILICAALPFLSFALSAAIGWVIAQISSRVRNKSFIAIVLFAAFMGLYFWAYSQMNVYIQYLVANGVNIAKSMSAALPVYWMGAAVSDGNLLYLLITLLICAIPFAAVMWMLSTSFINIATSKRGFAKIKYAGGEMKTASPDKALLVKELRHLTNSTAYLLNSAIGVLFFVAGAVALIVKQADINSFITTLPGFNDYISVIFCAAMCYISSMIVITAPSISIEGKTLWISQSMPVDVFKILNAKVRMHLVIALPPCVLASLVAIICFRMPVFDIIGVLLFPLVFNIFMALFGILTNLHFPKFDWINETYAVKQSVSAMICIFGSWGIILVPALLYGILLRQYISAGVFLLILTALFAAICAFLYHRLRTYGVKRFGEL